MYISAMPPTMHATLPRRSTLLKPEFVAGTAPSHATKWRQKGMEKTLLAATLYTLKFGQMACIIVPGLRVREGGRYAWSE